jgi:hypothetical protein
MKKQRVVWPLLVALLICPTFVVAQNTSVPMRAFQEGAILVKVITFGLGQHHLTVQAPAPETVTTIQRVLADQAQAVCGKPAKILSPTAEQRWTTVDDNDGRSTRVKIFIAFGVGICSD